MAGRGGHDLLPQSGDRNLRPSWSAIALRPSSTDNEVPRVPPRSNPLPQTQWFRSLEVQHARDRRHSDQRTGQLLPASLAPGPSVNLNQSDTGSSRFNRRSDPPNRRPRPSQISSTSANASYLQPDPTQSYPQMSPYDDSFGFVDAPSRSISQPVTPNFPNTQFHFAEPDPWSLARSSSYAGDRGRRGRSSPYVDDRALQDDEEVQLFIEATSGLGPIPTFRHGSMSEHVQPQHGHRDIIEQQSANQHFDSATEDTPTTTHALHHLASMPRSASPSPNRQRARTPPIDISDSGLNITIYPPEPTSTQQGDWLDFPDNPPDDELPDYASSQAQAQAEQRVEAARRAQELQRRWREGGRRYGC